MSCRPQKCKRDVCLICGRKVKHHHRFCDKHYKFQDYAGSLLLKYKV